MLAMMFNYINEETVMTGPACSRVGSLFISARGERGGMIWSEGKNGLIIRIDGARGGGGGGSGGGSCICLCWGELLELIMDLT